MTSEPTLVDLLNNRTPVRADDAHSMALFKDLQCNILTPHRYPRAHYWLLQFGDTENARLEARYLLGQLARNHFGRLTLRAALDDTLLCAAMSKELQRIAAVWRASAPCKVTLDMLERIRDVQVISEFERYWQAPATGEAPVSVNIFLSNAGYTKLGIAKRPSSQAFQDGMLARGSRGKLHDPPAREWDPKYLDRAKKVIPWDALLVVGSEPERHAQQVEALQKIVEAHATRFVSEVGDLLRAAPKAGEHGYAIEPFGYRDGVSQPLFYEEECKRHARQGSSWDPFAPLGLTLAPDPNGGTAYACGSYFVYRKLQQNIALFYQQSKQIADARGEDAEQLRAGLIGRKRDGQPLVPPSAARSSDYNDFDYDDDQRGEHCPFHAHVRKVNPRRDLREIYNPRKHRIVRRGIPYGPAIERKQDGAPVEPDKAPADIGLLFLCAQSDIEKQFEHIQEAWAHNPDHPRSKLAGVDPVSAQQQGRIFVRTRTQELPNSPYDQVVNLRGGEYFFAPSISFLRALLDDLTK
jgi:Dyp-type peroxidase family